LKVIEMNASEHEDLLMLLKTLADEQRLTMVGLMSQQEWTVGEMAVKLNLSEPTISHHVSKLHSAGLLTLRMAGNQRFYRINASRLQKFKAYAAKIEELPEEPEPEEVNNGWIDALDWVSDDKKVLHDYTLNGRLVRLPTKDKKWQPILRWLATKFQPETTYTEKQVNAILLEVHPDYATLRRYLVEFGFMRRERGGGNYWLTPEHETQQ
jgi:predicted transcriptional regulator